MFGANFINDFGSRQIDENYSNLCLHLKATFGGGQPFQYIDISSIPDPVIFARCNDPNLFIKGGTFLKTPADGKLYLGCDAGYPQKGGAILPSSAIYTVYVFSAKPLPIGSYGMAVFDSTGKATFSSNWKVLRVGMKPVKTPDLTFQQFSSNGSVPPITKYTAPYTATWAAHISGQRLIDDYDDTFYDGYRVVGNEISVGPMRVDAGNGSGLLMLGQGPILTIADVTDY